jgi:hypothetical protein
MDTRPLARTATVALTLGLACTDDTRGASSSGDELATAEGSDDTSGSSGQTEQTSSDGDTQTTSDGDTSTSDSETSTSDSTSDTGPACTPGEIDCYDAQSTQTCSRSGEWQAPVACAIEQTCILGVCNDECEVVQANPSTVGCSFFAAKMDNFYSNVFDVAQNDALIAGNVSSSKAVTAQLYYVPTNGGGEQPVGNPVMIAPQGTHTFVLEQAEIDSQTLLRSGGSYRLATNLPVVAYQHSPLEATLTNDASMLLPEHALTGNYVLASYPAVGNPFPSYLTIIGVEDGSLLDIEVRAATAAGLGVPALAAGETTSLAMERHSLLNLVVAQAQGGDLSGTIISSASPLHVLGATECAQVPDAVIGFCDHLQEAMLPLEYWGQEYVAAHAPLRSGSERYHWRVFAAADGVTIDSAPAQPGFPIQLDKGEFHQFAANPAPADSFVLTGDGPFMPVQYLEGQTGGAGTGDPSMVQSVPTEQFLSAYAFVTGSGYDLHYVQVIRPSGGADVFVDGELVGGYYGVGNYEVADVEIDEGAHFASSEQPFAIIQVGYTEATSYAYPGGMRLAVINPQ